MNIMVDEIKPNFKYFFLGHFVIAMTYGVLLLLFPRLFGIMANWPYEEFFFTRLSGALMIGFGAGSILAFRETKWERVEIYVLAEIVWLFVGLIVDIYGLIVITLVFMQWVNTLVILGLLGGFVWMYMKHK